MTFVGDRGPVELLAVGENATTYVRGDNIQDVIAAHGGMRRLLHNTGWTHYVVALPRDEADEVKSDIRAWMRSDDDLATSDDGNLAGPVSGTDITIQPRVNVATRTANRVRLQTLRRLRGNVALRIALGMSTSRVLSSDVPHDFDLLPCADQSLFEDDLEYHCLFVLRRNGG